MKLEYNYNEDYAANEYDDNYHDSSTTSYTTTSAVGTTKSSSSTSSHAVNSTVTPRPISFSTIAPSSAGTKIPPITASGKMQSQQSLPTAASRRPGVKGNGKLNDKTVSSVRDKKRVEKGKSNRENRRKITTPKPKPNRNRMEGKSKNAKYE